MTTPTGPRIYTLTGTERPYRLLVEQMSEGAVMLNEANVILFCNASFANMVQEPLEKIIGMNIEAIVSENHLNSFRELVSTCKINNQTSYKELTFQSGKKTIPVHVSANCLKLDYGLTTFLVLTDLSKHMEESLKRYTDQLEREITERKKVEEALKQAQTELKNYANNLENIIEERTRQLRESERLAAIGQTAGMVGHDIRNPLQAMTGDLYLIEEEIKNNPNCKSPDILQSIAAINENISYINKIVGDLQDYTRLIKPNFVELNLKDVIMGEIYSWHAPSSIAIQVTPQTNIKLKSDATILRRIIGNLVVNAIQAMPHGGTLTIDALKKNNSVLIFVQDTGVGIPEEIKPNVFKPLFTTKSKGQGLGLAVVKRLVEGLNGQISFESEENKGTKFTVKLPYGT